MEHVLYLRISTPRTASDAGGQRLIIVRPDLAGADLPDGAPGYLRAVDGTPLDLAQVAQGDGGETEVAGIYAGLAELDAHLREVAYYGPADPRTGAGPGTPAALADLARALTELGDGYSSFDDPQALPEEQQINQLDGTWLHPPRFWGRVGVRRLDTGEHALYYPDARSNR
jgi:hypothetical protein